MSGESSRSYTLRTTVGAWRRIETILSSLSSEGLLRVDKNGRLTMKFVDPSHVAMGTFASGADGPFTVSPLPKWDAVSHRTRDVAFVLQTGRRMREANAVSLTVGFHSPWRKDDRLVLDVPAGRMSYIEVDPSGVTEPKLPGLRPTVSASVLASDLQKAVQRAEEVSEHAVLRLLGTRFGVFAGHDASDEVAFPIRTVAPTSGDAVGVYAVDFLRSMVATMPVGGVVTLAFATDHPMSMSFHTEEGHWTYLLAPRVEHDDGDTADGAPSEYLGADLSTWPPLPSTDAESETAGGLEANWG